MKNFTLLILALFVEIAVLSAQIPQSFRYQAVARDNSGNVMENQSVSFNISILSGSVSGTAVYIETHSGLSTNAFGLVELEIGKGTPVTGTFSAINWGSNSYFVKIEMDPTGGTTYQELSTSQLLSVPYALYARQAANGFSGDYNDLINKPSLFDGTWNNLTGKPTTLGGYGITNAMSTSHEANGITSIMITNWNSAYGWGNHAGLYKSLSYLPSWTEITAIPTGFADGVDNVDDADNSTTNEIQVLSLSGNNLSLSKSGGTVIIPGDNWGTDNVKTDATLTGNGTVASPLEIATNGVNSSKILDGNISSNDLANSAVTTAKLDSLAVSTEKIQNGAVSSDKLANNSVVTDKINAGSVTGAKIAQAGASTGQALKWTGTTWSPADDAVALPYSGTGTSDSPLFNINNLGTSGAISTFSSGNYGIWGESGSTSGTGVYGVNKTSIGTTYGVFGDVYSPTGFSGFFQGGKFYIKGNTGIGTLDPAGMLEINGNSIDSYPQLLLSETDGYARINFRTMLASSKHWVLAGHTNQTDGDSQWHLNYFNGTAGKNIFSVYGNSNISFDGKVGIGTTAPGSLLQVHSNTTYVNNVTPIIKISDNYKTWNIGLGDPGDRFSISSEENKDRLTILKSNGFVGLGTTAPSAGLHIKANSWPGSFIYLEANSGSDAGMRFYEGTTPQWHIYNNAAAGGLQITNFNAQTAIFVKQSNSFVGIGTTNPTYTLDVAGGVNIIKGLSGSALLCNDAQAIWYNGTYFSWGYGGQYNYFADAVTIKSADVPGYDLVVNGSAAKTGGGSWSNLSDARMKNITGNYKKGLNEIIALQPVVFTYKEGNPRQISSVEQQVGFVAQDVQKVFPEAVSLCNDGYFDFNMHSVNVALVNAVKELKTENDRLKAKISSLESRFEEIEALINIQAEK